MWWVGVRPFLLVHLPIIFVAGAVGMWLFFVQHQFEHTVWSEDRDWSFSSVALYGSSHYDLPAVLRWFTANIGVHHVHHLCSRIPFYRLPHVLRDHPDLGNVGRLTLGQSLACVRLALWDEETRRLITFRELQNLVAGGITPSSSSGGVAGLLDTTSSIPTKKRREIGATVQFSPAISVIQQGHRIDAR
jgi:acyl-lipid omega-6 desaturase (Delta-12 desaturase)